MFNCTLRIRFKFFQWVELVFCLFCTTLTSVGNTGDTNSTCTESLGFITLKINGNEDAFAAFNLIGLGLYNEVEFQSIITRIDLIALGEEDDLVQVTEIIFSGNPFLNNQFNHHHFIEVVNGTDITSLNPGLIVDIVESSSNSVILNQDVSTLIAIGDGIRIRRHHTIASLFGSNNEIGLVENDATSPGDTIQLYYPITQESHYHSYSSDTGWIDEMGIPSGDVILYPDQGIIIHRVINTDLSVNLFGIVKNGPTSIPFEPGFNLIANTYPVDYTLNDSGLFTGDENTGIRQNDVIDLADRISILFRDGSFESYHYAPSAGGWVDSNLNLSGSVIIETGTSYILQRRETPINWTQEQPFQSKQCRFALKPVESIEDNPGSKQFREDNRVAMIRIINKVKGDRRTAKSRQRICD